MNRVAWPCHRGWDATRSRIGYLRAAVPPDVLLSDDTFLLGSCEGNNYGRLYPGFRNSLAETLAEGNCLAVMGHRALVFGPGWPMLRSEGGVTM